MENVTKFLNEAPDDEFLLIKVVLVFGLNGACRRTELCALKLADIEDTGTMLVVTLRDSHTKKKRLFTVTSECNGIGLYRKYLKLRPPNISHGRLFVYFKNGRCTMSPVGVHSFVRMPCRIAEFLELDNPKNYTGHCIRRTSISFLAKGGTKFQMLKLKGDQATSNVSEEHVEANVQIEDKVGI